MTTTILYQESLPPTLGQCFGNQGVKLLQRGGPCGEQYVTLPLPTKEGPKGILALQLVLCERHTVPCLCLVKTTQMERSGGPSCAPPAQEIEKSLFFSRELLGD